MKTYTLSSARHINVGVTDLPLLCRQRGYSQAHWRKVRAAKEDALQLRIARGLQRAAEHYIARAMLGPEFIRGSRPLRPHT